MAPTFSCTHQEGGGGSRRSSAPFSSAGQQELVETLLDATAAPRPSTTLTVTAQFFPWPVDTVRVTGSPLRTWVELVPLTLVVICTVAPASPVALPLPMRPSLVDFVPAQNDGEVTGGFVGSIVTVGWGGFVGCSGTLAVGSTVFVGLTVFVASGGLVGSTVTVGWGAGEFSGSSAA